MAEFSSLKTPIKLSKGYVNIDGKAVYAEIWQLEPRKHELRILIRPEGATKFRDVRYSNLDNVTFSKSFMKIEIFVSGSAPYDSLRIDSLTSNIHFENMTHLKSVRWCFERYVNNVFTPSKRRPYPSVWHYT